MNQAESAGKIRDFLKLRQWDLTVALDSDQKIARSYWVEEIPHTVVIDQQGRIAWAQSGYRAEGAKQLQSVVHELLTAQDPP